MSQTPSNFNLLTTTRWLCAMPIQAIDINAKSNTIAFNLTSFDLNGLTIAYDSSSFMGYSIDFPSFALNADKTMTFNYIPDSTLSQYTFLYKWFSNFANPEGSGRTPDIPLPNLMVPIRVFPLTEFKNPPIVFIFENSWIQALGNLSFDYQDAAASPVRHNFTIKYSKMTIENEPKY